MKSAMPASISRTGLFIILLSLPVSVVLAEQPAKQDKSSHSQAKTISLGFFPIISTVALYKRFAPLRDYLSDELGMRVALKTAKDFPTFVKRTDARQYDIVVTAPHFAVRAADSGKYRIRASLVGEVQQLIVVRKDSVITDIKLLAGKRVATPPKGALMTMMGIRSFSAIGLDGIKSPVYLHFTSHNAANEALLAGEVDAAIASSNVINKAIKRGDALRVIGHGERLPNMATMIATDLDPTLGDRVVKILVEMKNTDKGRAVLRQIAFPGYRTVSARDYEPARPYMEQVRAGFDKAKP